MSKNEAWQEVLDALNIVHQDRCVSFACGCKELIAEIKGALHV